MNRLGMVGRRTYRLFKEFMPGTSDAEMQQAHRLGSPASSQKGRDRQAWRLHQVKDEDIELEPLVGMHRPNPTIDLQVRPLDLLLNTVALCRIGRHNANVPGLAALVG